MGRGKPKRPYRLIGFKAYFEGDQAIIDWWESMDEGSRSDAIRDLIHQGIGLKPRQRKTNTLPDLLELQQDTRWIRQALGEMPEYLERLIGHAVLQPAALPDVRAPVSDEPALDDAESQRRARKLKRAGW
ncbi:MAG: hypothetical protein HY866_22945 [Chloroflexi bacterium]|nr:hypothetical protein [Chloroflexota bacterium]